MSLFSAIFNRQGVNIDVVQLKEMMDAKTPGTFYLDVRTPMEFSSTHIKGFKNIPVDQVPNRLSEIPKDKQVVVICQSGGRSQSAVRFLTSNGYNDILNVAGGIGAWRMNRF